MTPAPQHTVPVAILGAGLSGLCCARRLSELGVECTVLEASDRVGGRVATDRVDGFLLDRGFQVLLSEYSEAREVLDYDLLAMKPFDSGSLVRYEGKTHHLADGFRKPLSGLMSLLSPLVSLSDPLAIASIRRASIRYASNGAAPVDRSAYEQTIREYLRSRSLSRLMREAFLEPFFRGITFAPELDVGAWWFLEVFGTFARGNALLPERGMQSIPEQLAAALPEGTIRLDTRVAEIDRDARTLRLASGEALTARHVVVATDGASAARLLGQDPVDWFGTTTLYYAAEKSPIGRPLLMLDGDNAGPINHLCVPSDIQPSYAPAGKALVSANVVGIPSDDDEALDARARDQLGGWFGVDTVRAWQRLGVYRIPHALPRALPRPGPGLSSVHDGVFACGDYLATPSIQGAMQAGRAAAEAVAAERALDPARP